MSDGNITVNPTDLMNASKGVANVGGDLPGAFSGAASSLGTAAAANPGGFMGPSSMALAAAMGSALGKLGTATNDHSAWVADAGNKFTQADEAQSAAQKPITEGIDGVNQSLRPWGQS